MDTNKYYQPTKEEFHLGFEYQFLDCRNKWIPAKLDYLTDFTYNSVEHIYSILDRRSNWVRVKYLDRNDIEGLGWTYLPDKKGYCGEAMFEINHPSPEYVDDLGDTSYQLFIAEKVDGTIVPTAGDLQIVKYVEGTVTGHFQKCIFSGNIKSKNQLKTLMSWLKITQ